ncbi:hypothetical protein GCM10022198_00120 [Klugiella xanthotipulae]|uniref:Uncharacterized protein n=1 Tax=Klugiella xanthotipulae TaxID=244735 RepID=A0A543I5I6_9MICO|nr:hypothetical protein [Klugiella xanthotipulae]TQM65847.1 hypothetical protein FB466_0661 [Klugiella xanthotipulae]
MVARVSFPTGLATGLPILDTRLALASLIARDTTGAPRVGILPATYDPIVTGRATMAYTVADLSLVTSRDGRGVEMWRNDGALTVTTTAAPATNARIDVIYAKARFTLSADGVDTTIIDVVQGATAAIASLVKPAIPAGAVELATAQVRAGATATTSSSVIITQTVPYTATAGGVVPVRSATELAAWSPLDGAMAWSIETGVTYTRRGGVWVDPSTPLVSFETTTGVTNLLPSQWIAKANLNSGVIRNLGGFVAEAAQIRVPSPGIYGISCAMQFGGSAAGTARGIRLSIDGVASATNLLGPGGRTSDVYLQTGLAAAAVTSTVAVFGYQDTGGNLNSATTNLQIHRLGGLS